MSCAWGQIFTNGWQGYILAANGATTWQGIYGGWGCASVLPLWPAGMAAYQTTLSLQGSLSKNSRNSKTSSWTWGP